MAALFRGEKMSTFLKAATIAAVTFCGAQAHALTIADQTFSITANGQNSTGELAFEITQAGTYELYTMGPTIDPVLYLFEDDNGNGNVNPKDAFVAFDDDSCPDSFCGTAGSYYNSYFEKFLSVGDYIAVVGDWPLTESAARTGVNNNSLVGDVRVVVSQVSTVPVPASLPLLAGALGAFGFLRRKKKQQTA